MLLRTFTAADVPSAVRQIRETLGPEAVIVSTRPVKARRGAFGLFSSGGVEITAAIEPDAGPGREGTRDAPVPKILRRDGAERTPGLESASRRGNTLAVVGDDLDEEIARTAAAREETPEPRPEPRERVMFYIKPIREELRTLTTEIESLKQETRSRQMRTLESNSGFARMRSEIAELRYLVGRMSEAVVDPASTSLPDPLRSIAMQLADAGVDLTLIAGGLQRLAQTLTPDQLSQEAYVRECVLAELMRLVAVSAPLESGGQRARVLALVGPTGVGKTTTAAKIAGQLLLERREARVAFLTLDTYRVGALDHLRHYGEMLGLPVHVATNAAELDRLVRAHLDHDLVLVDTTGGNPKDDRLMGELHAFISPNPLIETHLCVSATTKPRDLRDIHERFSSLAIEKLIFTKIDETNCGGSLFNFLTLSGKPLTYLTNGQQVPEDLRVATRDGFCRWVMGE